MIERYISAASQLAPYIFGFGVFVGGKLHNLEIYLQKSLVLIRSPAGPFLRYVFFLIGQISLRNSRTSNTMADIYRTESGAVLTEVEPSPVEETPSQVKDGYFPPDAT